MDKIVCKLCAKKFEDDSDFHKHLKSHKLTQTEYYQTHYPRFDRYDGSIIKYKNKEYYFNSEFNSKNNFKRWLSSVSPIVGRQYVVDFLISRKNKKNLIFAPTQVELRTLMMPGIKYINDKLGGYQKICEQIGLKSRFIKNSLDVSLLKDITNKVIFADTREQMPLDFDNTTRTKGMSYGDYRMSGSNVFIERKSAGDAWGTLIGGFERFEREIVRAKEANSYLIVLVECSFSELEGFPLQRQVRGKIKAPVEFVYRNIRYLLQKYDHIQFLFVENREEASRVVQKIFSIDEQVKEVDLQYLYDIKNL